MKLSMKRLGCLGCFLAVVGIAVLAYLKLSACFDGGLKEVKSFPFEHVPTCLAFSSDGKLLGAVGGNEVRIWEMDTGMVRPLSPSLKSVISLAFSPDGQHLAVGCGKPGEIILYDAQTLQERARTKIDGEVMALASSPDSRLLAASCVTGETNKPGQAKLLKLPSLKDTGTSFEAAWSWVVSFSHDSKTLAFIDTDKESSPPAEKVVMVDVVTGQEKRTLKTAQKNYIKNLAFSADGQTLAILGDRLQLWNLTNDEEFAIPAPSLYYRHGHLSFSPDGKLIAVSDSSGGGTTSPYQRLFIWDLAEKKERFLWEHGNGIVCHRKPVPGGCMAFSPDGKTLAMRAPDAWKIVIYELPK